MDSKRPLQLALRLVAVCYVAALVWMSVMQTRLIFPGAYFEAEAAALPIANAEVAWDTLSVETNDGSRAVLLISPHPESTDSSAWALFFHGNAGFLGRGGSIARYRLLHDAGFNVAAVEFRGYGSAAELGSPSEAAFYADAQAAWDYLVGSLGVRRQEIVLYGWSLGSGPATYLATRIEPAGLVTEGAFTSVPDVGAELYPWLPVRLLARHRFPNLERAEGLSVRWLVFHAVDDREIPFEHGEALAAAAENAELYPLRGGHDDAVLVDRAVTLGALRELAEKVQRERM